MNTSAWSQWLQAKVCFLSDAAALIEQTFERHVAQPKENTFIRKNKQQAILMFRVLGEIIVLSEPIIRLQQNKANQTA